LAGLVGEHASGAGVLSDAEANAATAETTAAAKMQNSLGCFW
jgi:hypothetical protein